MLWEYAEYYPLFRCLAGDCPDTCCAGWALPVDGESLSRYRAMEGPLGEKLRAKIDWREGCLIPETDGRCPFLTRDNLCELILEKGEECLCKVCATHPRFYEDFGTVRQVTLSNACPEAARLLLTLDHPVRFLREGEGECAGADEKRALGLSRRCIALAQNRRMSPQARLSALFRLCGGRVQPEYPEEHGGVQLLAEAFSELEILTGEWRELLTEMETPAADWAVFRMEAAGDETAWENLFVYFLFHYLPSSAAGGEALAGAKLCAACFLMVREAAFLLWRREGRRWSRALLERAARLFAREFEHDRDNVDQMLFAMHGGYFRQRVFLRLI